MNFICAPCKIAADVFGPSAIIAKKNYHAECKGGTWCDCQHKVKNASKS